MVACRDIVNGAMRKIGKLGAGREPRLADQTDVMATLKDVYRQLIMQGSLGRLSDVVPTGATYVAGENERVFRNSDATLQITLPETYDAYRNPRTYSQERVSYEGILGSKRPPRDCAVVVIVDAFTGITVEYIYDGHRKVWQPIADLTLDSDAPLARDRQGLQAFLAGQIADEFAAQTGPATQMQAAAFLSALTNRFSMPRTTVAGVYI